MIKKTVDYRFPPNIGGVNSPESVVTKIKFLGILIFVKKINYCA